MSGAPSPEELRALEDPRAHPSDPSAQRGVEFIQTHISDLFLTPERVYKFRKDVDLGFVCFTSRRERNADCLREVALNRRLAPDVYMGVAPLCAGGGRVWIGPVAETLDADEERASEHCVVMRRLPGGRDALTLLEAGNLSERQVDRVAVRVAEFHRANRLGAPAPFSREAWLDRCTGPAEDNFRLLAEAPPGVVPAALLDEARERARAFARDHADRFERRRVEGRAVDGHGDLHLQHVWFESDDAEPLVIDCLEFSERLRRIDAAAEVAFPHMDLVYRGHPSLAERFLRIYALESDDFDLYGVVDYFASYRAAVRAKVASVVAGDAAIPPEQRAGASKSATRHLELAARALEPSEGGALVLVGGVIGTGKSTAARSLADALDACVVASDRVRKHQAGVAPAVHLGAAPGQGMYTPEAKERVYDGMLERARAVIGSGRIAILDATWSRREHRRRARELAGALGVRALFVETRCSQPEVLRRLERREAEGRDPSDAGPSLYASSVAEFEPFDPEQEGAGCVVRTDQADGVDALRGVADDLRTRARIDSTEPGGLLG